MARKSLLTESEIRRFMKLASVQPMGDPRMRNLQEQGEELEMGAEMPPGDVGAEGDLPVEGGEELEMGVEEEPEAEMGDDAEKEAMLADVVQAVADVLGVDVDVEGAGEEEAPPEEELEMGAEVEEPLPGGGEEELEMGAEEEVPGMRGMYQEQQEKIVNEVARRVALRLAQETQRDQMADQLAERILKRLTK